jgi:hypothetical protein
MRVVCTRRKSETNCTKDDQCEWKNGVCVQTLKDQLLHICKHRRSKEDLLYIAKELGVSLPSKNQTIAKLCDHIELHLPKLWEGQKLSSVKRQYDRVVMQRPPTSLVIPAPISSTNPMYDRVATYHNLQTSLKTEKDKDFICDLKAPLKKIRRIGTPSVYGQVFLVEYTPLQELQLAAKVMKNTTMNMHETKLYKQMNQLVIGHRTPHMPLVFQSQICDKTIALLTELAQGDLRAWLEKGGITSLQLMSMIAQVILALFSLESTGYTHHDLHWGNLLYHEQPEREGAYIYYRVQGHDIYVRHAGVLWTLWDFGLMKKSTYPSQVVREDLFRILHFNNWMKDKHYPKLPISAEWLMTLKNACATSKTVLDVWRILVQTKTNPTSIVIDPSLEWVSKSRILYSEPFKPN